MGLSLVADSFKSMMNIQKCKHQHFKRSDLEHCRTPVLFAETPTSAHTRRTSLPPGQTVYLLPAVQLTSPTTLAHFLYGLE
jgi:hypothetical protein